MTNQELIQEAAVIRDERNQYANTAERVGTALVHMAEQIAAQGDDVDKIEAEVRGALTLAQLDNPLGFTTKMQWAQGLNEDKSYTFRLVDTSGRCIGHVWLLNDADFYNDSSKAARFIEVAMCCASIDAGTGALTTDARWGSPRLYYRTYCTPLSGGTPDGGLTDGFKWSTWQEYREYIAKPIKDALAALQQQHATDVANLQANIDATDLREGTPTATTVPLVLTKSIKDTVTCNLGAATTARAGVMTADQFKRLGALREKTDRLRDLGNYSTIGELDNAAAAIVDRSVQMSVGDLPFLMYGTVANNNTVIYLQTLETSDFPCIRQVRMYEGGGAGMMERCIILDEDDFEHDTLVSVSIDEFTSFIPDRITAEQDSDEMRLRLRGLDGSAATGAECIVHEATTTTAGVMTAMHVQELADAKAKADKEAARHYTFDTKYNDIYEFIDTTCEESPEVWANENIEYVHSHVIRHGLEYPVTVHKSTYTEGDYVKTACYIYFDMDILFVDPAFVKDAATGTISYDDYSSLDSIATRNVSSNVVADHVEIVLEGFEGSDLSTAWLFGATSDKAGVMTAAHVQKLADLEARIAALEAK